jgi:hypothetical protein
MPPSELHRRAFLVATLPLLTAIAPPTNNPSSIQSSGFSITMAPPLPQSPNFVQIANALMRQIDITAGCGVKAEIMTFFKNQRITAVPSTGKGGGRFGPAIGVEIDTNPLPPPDNPVLLHELIHALHHGYMPNGNANPDVERFFQIAKQNNLYPQAHYMMSNKNEFFAVSASLYLWGVIARAPFKRENLQAAQPVYYGWLGDVFGVKK